MGKVFFRVLPVDVKGKYYSCKECNVQLAWQGDVLSKQFQGRHGRAYLFRNCLNVHLGPSEERLLITGLHTVADLFCHCGTLLGWKYVSAEEQSQQYKVGHFILEKEQLKTNRFEE